MCSSALVCLMKYHWCIYSIKILGAPSEADEEDHKKGSMAEMLSDNMEAEHWWALAESEGDLSPIRDEGQVLCTKQ